MNPKISASHLKKRAIVYIRQSSPGQVTHNQESLFLTTPSEYRNQRQRRQYGLADHARRLGFQQVQIIDEDLGRPRSGQVERPGSSIWLRRSARERLAPCFALRLPVWPVTAATGII